MHARSKEKSAIKKLEKEVAACEQVQKIVQELAQQAQQNVHAQISTVVSKCLATVFGDEAYDFRISFLKKRGKTEAVLAFYRDGHEIDPLEEAGGGVVDIACFALRVACVLASQPKLRKLIILDEPFRHVSKSLQPLAGQLLLEFSQETGIQFVVITHSAELGVGKIIEIQRN